MRSLAKAEDYATEAGARQWLRFLRSQAASLRFGSARLNVAGVDYQKKGIRYLTGAEGMLRANEFNLLLSHNPDVFRKHDRDIGPIDEDDELQDGPCLFQDVPDGPGS